MGAQKEVLLTLDGLTRLEKELDQLKTVRRREVAERIKQALEFGDISENSEYEDAKNEQGFIESRILQIENILRNARVLDEGDVDTETVGLGSRVVLEEIESGEDFDYLIAFNHHSVIHPTKRLGKLSNGLFCLYPNLGSAPLK